MNNLCNLWGYSRQSYYKWLRVDSYRSNRDTTILSIVRDIRLALPRIGCVKLWKHLNNNGLRVGRDYLFSLLRENGLTLNTRKSCPRTTDSSSWFNQHDNLVKGLQIHKVNQVWVSDITYLTTLKGFVYLSLITDAYSRYIVGFHVHINLDTEGSFKALMMALLKVELKEVKGLIHHSDRGSQYCSSLYVNMLKNNKILVSTTQNGNPYDNAMAERVNGILKREWLDQETLQDIEHASKRISQIIELYNNKRLHMGIAYNTPLSVFNGSVQGRCFQMY